MKLREAIAEFTSGRATCILHNAEAVATILNAVADGTLIPADAVFQVKDGYYVRAYKLRGSEAIIKLQEALEIRSEDDVRREAMEEAARLCDAEMNRLYDDRHAVYGAGLYDEAEGLAADIRALIDTPQPKAEPLHFDDWKPGISTDAAINKLQPKGGDDE